MTSLPTDFFFFFCVLVIEVFDVRCVPLLCLENRAKNFECRIPPHQLFLGLARISRLAAREKKKKKKKKKSKKKKSIKNITKNATNGASNPRHVTGVRIA